MFMDRCEKCRILVDTDEDPGAYAVDDRCLCWVCRAVVRGFRAMPKDEVERIIAEGVTGEGLQ